MNRELGSAVFVSSWLIKFKKKKVEKKACIPTHVYMKIKKKEGE